MSKEFTFSDVSEHTSKVNLTKTIIPKHHKPGNGR
jgi:hypothetical protein